MRKLSLFLTLCLSLFDVSPALALDNAWITNPNLSSISITGGSVTGGSSSYTFSTQAKEAVVHFTGSAGQANKFAQVNFFDFTGGVALDLESGTAGVSSTACDHQTLGGNSHTCFFQLDENARASFRIMFANANASSHFKLKVLAGPNITESADAMMSFAEPTSKIHAIVKDVRGISGGPGVVQFRVTDHGKPVAGVKVSLRFKGIGENLSAKTVLSDSRGFVTAYLTNLKFHRGSAKVTASVVGGHSKASTNVWWFKVKYL